VPATSPPVWIVVLTWNGRQDTLACLRSLKNVSYPNFRIIVVDNASSDGTAEAVRKEFPGVEILLNSSNLRFAGGNNAGIRRALEGGAEYVLLLNNDTVVKADFLGKLVSRVEGDERAGMAGPKIYYFSQKDLLWYAGGKIEWWKGWISHKGVREVDRGQYDTPGETDYITGCCLLVKRSVIERVGMLDESYFIYGEDADWCVRAARAGFRLLYVPDAVLWHKLSVSTGGHLSWFKNWNKLKSQLRLFWRYAKPYHWLTIPFCMVISVLKGYLNSQRRA
jgi:GT2 family glycosyltransferase